MLAERESKMKQREYVNKYTIKRRKNQGIISVPTH